MQRYAREILDILDRTPDIAEKLSIAVPAYYTGEIPFENIRTVRYGTHRGKLWRQLDLARYLREQKAEGLFLENIVPLLYRRGIVVLHDIIFRARPDFFTWRPRGIVPVCFWRTVYRAIAASDMTVVTVSEFTKTEIMKYYKVPAERIHIAGNGWEHIRRAGETELPEEMAPADFMPELAGKPYLMTLASSSTRHKNTEWFFRAAAENPSVIFVVAGGVNKKITEGAPENMLFPGYISDSQVRSLMKNCAAFVFPSYYEGFGIPPLEAAASGAPRLFLSDIPVLHEVYGDLAEYIDPYGNGEELPALLQTPEKDFSALLSRHTWERSAEKLQELLQ